MKARASRYVPLSLCDVAGLAGVECALIEQATEVPNFEEFWRPFTLSAGPAPGYCKSLSDEQRAALTDSLAGSLGRSGPIRLPARALAAVRAKKAT